MELTRVHLTVPTELELTLTGGVNVVDELEHEELQRVRDAVAGVMSGVVLPGVRVWTQIDGIEFELTPDIVQHLPSAIGPIPIVNASALLQGVDANSIALRAALEVLDAIPHRLTIGSVDRAMSEKSRDHRQLVAKATAKAELERVRNRTSSDKEIRELVACNYCLHLRRLTMTDETSAAAPSEADRRALARAIDVLRPIDARRLSTDPIDDAAMWLEHLENRNHEQSLIALVGQRSQPHSTLGLIPVVIDSTDPDSAPSIPRLGMLLAEFTKKLQVIHLGTLPRSAVSATA